MTSVNDFHERSPRVCFWENFTSLQGVEGVSLSLAEQSLLYIGFAIGFPANPGSLYNRLCQTKR